MAFYDNFELLCKERGITATSAALECGISQPAVSMWKKRGNTPKYDTLKKLADYFGVSVNFLLGKQVEEEESELTHHEREHIKKYRTLDRYGKELVDIVTDREAVRCKEELARRRERKDPLDEYGEPEEARVIPLYFTPAAAGYASPAFGEDFEYLEVEGDRQADYAVRIDGNSMEPYIADGSIVYVNRDPLADGDIGIFFIDGDILCKQYKKDADGTVHLLSLNRDRADADRHIKPDSGISFTCLGRVMR